MPCIKHEFVLVNNRYKDGKPVTKGGEWVTEKKCSKCGEVLEVKQIT
jgi:hypothetical protein